MKFETKYKICLWKRYFENGNAIANYLIYIIAFFGLIDQDVKRTIILGFIYVIFCFFLGRYWITRKWLTAEMEVGNRVNPFVKEMRKSINRKV